MNKRGAQAKAGGLWATEVQELTHKVPPTAVHIQAVVSPVLPASGLQPLRWPGTWDPGINQSLSLENRELVKLSLWPVSSLQRQSIPKGLLPPTCEEYRSPASFSSSTRWRHSSGYGWAAHWLTRPNSFKIHQLCSALRCLLCFSEDIFFSNKKRTVRLLPLNGSMPWSFILGTWRPIVCFNRCEFLRELYLQAWSRVQQYNVADYRYSAAQWIYRSIPSFLVDL